MERVTRSEAARRLGVDKATVTRFVQSNPALLDADGRVDPEEVARLRADTLHPGLQTRGRRSAPVPKQADAAVAVPGLNAHRSRAEGAKADLTELDLAQRLGMTLARADVETAVAAAGEELKQAAFSLARDRAERLAAIDDVRDMERALEDTMRELLTRAAQKLTLAASPTDTAHAA